MALVGVIRPVAELWRPLTDTGYTCADRPSSRAKNRVSIRSIGTTASAGLQSEVACGVRQSHRAGGQHRRDRLPDTPPRPAGV